MPASCFVIRDREERRISSDHLVVGDLVNLRVGQYVPADIRLLQSNGLKIEASAISGRRISRPLRRRFFSAVRGTNPGETIPIDYTHEEAAPHVSLFDAHNIAFKGSYCVEGDAIGVVIKTGGFTVW
jgi:magnesium-transporting ATPase (P-type)